MKAVQLNDVGFSWHPRLASSPDWPPSRPLSVALGMFDGVHLGHQSVIRSATESAHALGGGSAVLTFVPHPSRILRPEEPTRLIFTRKEKERRLFHCGVEAIFWMNFTPDLAKQSAATFIANLKQGLPGLATLHVGANFRFGAGRSGDIDALIALGQENGIDVLSVDRFRHNRKPVSSSRIRLDLTEGNLSEVNRLLGTPYGMHGEVVQGASLGRRIGFPTLNLNWEPEHQPAYGVYAVQVKAPGKQAWEAAVANFGVRPTVNESEQAVLEIHLLEWREQFGPRSEIEVEWLHFLRSETRFPSQEELRVQIAKDVETARSFFEQREPG